MQVIAEADPGEGLLSTYLANFVITVNLELIPIFP